MSVIERFDFIGEDSRKRKFLMPKKIVETSGEVIGVEKLLDKKTLQIGLGEPSVTDFINGEDGENASVTLDFGSQIHGGIRLLVCMSKGENPYPMIKLTFGESLSEVNSQVGADTSTNDHSPRQFSVPIPRLSDTVWGETGFRFVKLEVLDKNVKWCLKSAVAVFVYHELPYIGSFECDDPEVNKIYDTAAYTVHLCLQNMVWDGIKRDRLVWIGDMMIETMTVRNLFGRVPLVEESLDFVRDQTPLPGWMNTYSTYSMWWVLILKDWYFATGNREFLERQKAYLDGLVRQLCQNVTEDGKMTFSGYFLDWPTNSNPKTKAAIKSLLKMTLEASIELLKTLGLESTVKEAENCLERLAKDKLSGGDVKQIVAMQSLAGDIDSSVAADIITRDGIKGFSTFMGYHLLAALAKAGRYSEALRSMKEYYSMMLKKGATTFFEDYDTEWDENSSSVDTMPENGQRDIHADFGAYCYKGLRHSLCHGWAAGPVPYLTEYVLGVTVNKAGCKALKIEPHLDGLQYAKGTFPTPFGVVAIEHRRLSDGTVDTKVTAPDLIEIEICKN